MVLSTKDKKARKAHNRDRRASTAAEKQAIALREACIPEARWPSPITAPTAATGFSGVLYEGRPALVGPDMADDAEPVGFVHVKDYSDRKKDDRASLPHLAGLLQVPGAVNALVERAAGRSPGMDHGFRDRLAELRRDIRKHSFGEREKRRRRVFGYRAFADATPSRPPPPWLLPWLPAFSREGPSWAWTACERSPH